MMSSGIARYEHDAMKELLHQFFDDAVGFYGHIERPRLAALLPVNMYEKSFKKLTTDYILEAAHRISQIDHWGSQAEGLWAMIRGIKSPELQSLAENAVRGYTGKWPVSSKLPLPLREAADVYTAVNTALRIGGGTATMANLFQPVISAFAEAGYVRGIRGLLNYIVSSDVRQTVRMSGAQTFGDAVRVLAGYRPSGRIATISDVVLELNLFNPQNRAWNALSATVGKTLIEDLAKIHALGPKFPLFKGLRREWASNYLKDLGVDLTAISPEGRVPLVELQRGMYNFASRSQLHNRAFDQPALMNDPRFRPLWLFKRFGYKQAAYAYDIGIKTFHKNPMPLLRLMAGGLIGGEFVAAGRYYAGELLRHITRGEKIKSWTKKRAKTPLIVRGIENLAAIGTLGMITDLGWPSAKDERYTLGGTFSRAWMPIAPVQVRDLVDLYNMLIVQPRRAESLSDLAKGFGKAAARVVPLGAEALREE